MKNVVLIEGLDLVGKTTLCEKLVNSYPNEFVYRKGIYSDGNDLYQETIKKSKMCIYSEETIAWMYFTAAKHELDLMVKTQEKKDNKIVIQDSFFLNRMIGVHAIKERKILIEAIDELIKKFEFPKQVFYIYTDLDTRQKRFLERKKFKEPAFSDKLVFESKKEALFREQLFRKYITKRYNAEILDNTNINIEKLVEKVYNKIKSKNIEKDMEER